MPRRRLKKDGYEAWRPLSDVLRNPAPVERPIETPAPVEKPTTKHEPQSPEVASVSRASLPQRYRDLHERAISRLERELEGMEHGAFLSAFRTLEERLYGKAVQPLKVESEFRPENLTLEENRLLLALIDKARGNVQGATHQALLSPPPSESPITSDPRNPSDGGRGFGSKTLLHPRRHLEVAGQPPVLVTLRPLQPGDDAVPDLHLDPHSSGPPFSNASSDFSQSRNAPFDRASGPRPRLSSSRASR